MLAKMLPRLNCGGCLFLSYGLDLPIPLSYGYNLKERKHAYKLFGYYFLIKTNYTNRGRQLRLIIRDFILS